MNTRVLVAEYLNDANEYFHKDVTASSPSGSHTDDGLLVERIIEDFRAKGFTVYAVYEILGGYTFKEFDDLSNKPGGCEFSQKHMNMLYYNKIAEHAHN